MVEIVPLWLVNLLSFMTVFSVMASIGTTITPEACFAHLRSPGLLIRGLASVLVAVPVIGIAAGFAFGLSLPEKVGITLMAIAPGAPLALRRALGSGADAGFAPTLQVAVAILAVPAVTGLGDHRQRHPRVRTASRTPLRLPGRCSWLSCCRLPWEPS